MVAWGSGPVPCCHCARHFHKDEAGEVTAPGTWSWDCAPWKPRLGSEGEAGKGISHPWSWSKMPPPGLASFRFYQVSTPLSRGLSGTGQAERTPARLTVHPASTAPDKRGTRLKRTRKTPVLPISQTPRLPRTPVSHARVSFSSPSGWRRDFTRPHANSLILTWAPAPRRTQ